MYNKATAKEAYKKFIRSNKRFLFLTDRSQVLKNFVDVQKENKAYNSVYLGVKNVPISKIVGSVQKYTDFDKNFVPINKIVEARWCNIYLAFLTDQALPLVQLYKLKDNYYVYDGNHRISVANHLRFATIEAEVTEFLPSKDEKEEAIYRERFLFEKEYGIGDFDFTELYFFGRIKKEIKQFSKYLKKVEGKEDLSRSDRAKIWYRKLYKVAYEILEINEMNKYFNNKSLSDTYVYYLDHKYYESEKRGYNLGFYEGLISFINTIISHANKELDIHIDLSERSIELLKNLEDLDFRYNTSDIYRYDLLTKHFGQSNYRNYRLSTEITEYMKACQLSDFEEAIKLWKSEVFEVSIDGLIKRSEVLEAIYKESLSQLTKEKLKLYFSMRDYERIYKIKYKEENYGGIVNYILDIFIPIASFINEKRNTYTLHRDYFGIFEKYHYLIEYNPNVSMNRAIELYLEEVTKRTHALYDRVIGRSKVDLLLDNLPKAIELKNTGSFKILADLVDEYGLVQDYAGIIKIYEYIQHHLERGYSHTEVEVKVLKDIEKVKNDEDLNSYFKNIYTLNYLESSYQYSFLDLFQEILNKGNYLGENITSINILDLAKEYLKEKLNY